LNRNNTHKSGYNFKLLTQVYPKLDAYVFENAHQTVTIDFADPKAVKALNTALLKAHYKINFWEFPEGNLCPPIPGRVDYIHYLADVLKASGIQKDATIMDIGTGASCIYPLLGQATYDWHFLATEIDEGSMKHAQIIVEKNGLDKKINLRHQADESQILKGVLKPSEYISASMCNPPFYKSKEDAQEATSRKLKGLGTQAGKKTRNFSGTSNELWYTGGEKAFLHNYLYESSLFKTQCFWYTSLVSKKENVKSMKSSLKKLGATDFKIIPMIQGQKISRIIAWTFLTKAEQKLWRDRL